MSKSNLSNTNKSGAKGDILHWLQKQISMLVVLPSFAIVLVLVYGFILWTGYISLSQSTMLPNYEYAGLAQYVRLWSMPRWYIALENMVIFSCLYIFVSLVAGMALAIFLDQRIRMEGTLRTIFLYPMALSFIVTGTAWKWILNPGLGLQKFVQDLGFDAFTFDWITNRDMVVYTLVIAAVWQSSGFVMALFLAALRGVDQDILKAAYIDGASLPRIYTTIIIPTVKPVFLSAIVILAHLSIKSYDLVVAMTAGGPGVASDLPATFMFAMTFQRNQLGVGAASAIMMLATIMAIMVPYFYSQLRGERHV